MDKKTPPRSLPGFMELLPSKQTAFEDILNVLRGVYSAYGFYPLDTPILEHSEVLLAKAGGETEKQIYRFTKGDTDMTMRFDLTVPLAKYVALNYNQLEFPFRRYQIGKVYRGERAQRGRYREFYQADIDVIGDGELGLLSDAEMPAVIYDIFTRLGIKDFTIRMNNRKILSGFFEIIGVSGGAADILRVVDKLPKIGREKVEAELSELGVSKTQCDAVLGFVQCKGTTEQRLAAAEKYAGHDPQFDVGLDELRTVLQYAADLGIPPEYMTADFSIARGLDYYTGTVYETIINAHPEIGSVCSGGRYDNLAEFYTDKKLPGVGLSIGLTRLFYLLDTMGAVRDGAPPADVLVVSMTGEMSAALRTAAVFRDAGLRTQVYPEDKKFKKKMQYADRLGIPYVAILGDDEIAAGTVTLKCMADGGQQTLAPDAAVKVLQEFAARQGTDGVIKL